MKTKVFKLQLGGRELKIEIRNLAERANADVLVSYGDTMLLATCVMSKEERKGLGFFPLIVDYEERYYAAGKIGGGRFIKREARPSDEAICNARLVDRSIRPRFSKKIKRDVQVVLTILSWDSRNDPDVLGLLAASIALSISDIPWLGPISAVRVGRINGEFVLNPVYEERNDSELDMIFAGGESGGEFLINMIEGNFNEVSEDFILQSFEFAKKDLKSLLDFQKDIVNNIGKEKIKIEEPPRDPEIEKEVRKFLEGNLEKAVFQKPRNQLPS